VVALLAPPVPQHRDGAGELRIVGDDGAALAARVNPPARFSTRTTIGALLADPQARAVVEKHLPRITKDPRVDQALGMTLREAAPYEPTILTEELLGTLDRELAGALAQGEQAVGDRLEKAFERTLILRALAHTGGHRMEAAQRLGWGRNTLTRKIQELGLEAELRKR